MMHQVSSLEPRQVKTLRLFAYGLLTRLACSYSSRTLTPSIEFTQFIVKLRKVLKMDSEVIRDGRIMDLIDEKWREDQLPMEDIAVPQMELPELEPDNGPTSETQNEQEQKWTDLALSALHEQPSTTTS